jgi:hypothetical protein
MVSPQQARELLSLHGEVRPQSATEWTGAFFIPPRVEQFYRDVGPVDVTIDMHGNPYFLPRLSELWEFQAGYPWNGLTGETIEDWPEEWLVVAAEAGDPFILSLSHGVILHAYHGEGEWDAGLIFPDLNTMAACLAQLGAVVKEAGETFTDDHYSIRPEHRKRAAAELSKLLGYTTLAEYTLEILRWG